MADFATRDIYKEFINLIEYYEEDVLIDLCKYKDSIIKIIELKNLWERIVYNYFSDGYGSYFTIYFNNNYMVDDCTLDGIASYLDECNNYNIIFAPRERGECQHMYIMGLSSDGRAKTVKYTFSDISNVIEKHPDYDFRRIWPTNDIKIALKD
jgi:hypothetical protein